MTRLGLGLMVGMYNNSVSDSIEARTINELLDLPAISLDFNERILRKCPTHPTHEKMSRCITNGWQSLQTFHRKLQKALR